jgi:hypothetical protein
MIRWLLFPSLLQEGSQRTGLVRENEQQLRDKNVAVLAVSPQYH